MRISVLGLGTKQTIGLFLGVIGFIFPLLLFPLPGLSFAGHLALGIFILAAFFWMTEPIPIYATSMMVIFLQISLLSAQSPIFQQAELSTSAIEQTQEHEWAIPEGAITEAGGLWVMRDSESEHIPQIEVVGSRNGVVLIASEQLQEGDQAVTEPNSVMVNYEPTPYPEFFGTLANPIIILFLGGFMLAAGAVKYNLDKNLTRYLLKPFGTRPLFIMLGLMLVTAVLSAFMSNTATTAMMVTVILPIIGGLEARDRFKVGIALAIPFSANIGGIATPIGTPPNAIALAAINETEKYVSFTDWMALATPVVLIMLLFTWWLLLQMYKPSVDKIELNLEGRFLTSPKAIMLYVVFAITVLMWVTENQHGIPSTMIAFIPVAGLLVTGVLDKDDIRSLPWEVLWLVAGGISLGISMDDTGLAMWMIEGINWAAFGAILMALVFSAICVGLSNFLSNTVTATLVMPLGISLWSAGVLPEPYGLVAIGLVISVSCSLAMVLPISTPPNAIAMSTGIVETPDMARTGVIIGVVAVIIVVAHAVIYWPLLV